MFSILLAVQVLISVAIISLVMLQQGKGADMGAAFGSGSSGTVFGARGSGSFFTRATAILAAVFFINCLLIASPLVRNTTRPDNTLADKLEQQAVQQQTGETATEPEQAVAPEDAVPAEPGAGQNKQESDVPVIPPDSSGAPVADEQPQ